MTDGDALTMAMHAISHELHDVEYDGLLDEEERTRRLDELNEARDRLRVLRRSLVVMPVLPLANGGDTSAVPTAMTPDVTAECVGLGDGTV